MIRRNEPIALRGYALLSAAIIAAGLLWRIDALNAGFMVDDYPQIAIRDGFYPVARSPLDLFSFSHGGSAENAALRDAGVFPWWSHPELRIAMLRPLASLLLVLDGALFGNDAYAYHVHSALWWIAMNVVLAAVLRRALPGWAAPLALALFVADEAHTSLLSWIAMRNATVASTFALLGLWAQLRARDDDAARWTALLALASYALALAAGEYALAFLGYAVVLELSSGKNPAAYARRLIGPALLLGCYLALRGLGRFGAMHSSIYLEPASSPFAFARAAVPRFLVLVGDLVAAIPASAWTWGIRWPLGFLQRGLVPRAWAFDFDAGRVLLQWLGWAALAIGVWIGRRCLRAGREHDIELRWLVLGTPLAVLPLLCSFPENRLLVPAQLGWAAMLAYLVFDATTRAPARAGGLGPRVVATYALALYHVLMPLAQARGEVREANTNAAAMRAAILAPALDRLLANKRRVFLLGAADPTTSIYLPLVRKLHGRPAPGACLLLSSCAAPQILHRLSPSAFTLERTFAGYTAADTYAAFFTDRPLHRGDSFTLDGMRVHVERAQGGRPLRVRYDFDSALDDSSAILVQTATGLVPLTLPALGARIFVPPPLPLRL